MAYSPYSSSAETVLGISEFSVRFIERNIIRLKDKISPPSQKTLDKRLKGYTSVYLFGIKGAMPVIQDALKKGANPNQQVDIRDGDWKVVGTEPLIATVIRGRGDNLALAEALIKAGADIQAKDSDGKTAEDTNRYTVSKLAKTTGPFNKSATAETPAQVTAPVVAATAKADMKPN